MVAAACGADHRSLESLLTYLEALDDVWATEIAFGLRQFDAHHTLTERGDVVCDRAWHEPFRVVDAETRAQSMRISSLGLFVVNLRERRIVQVDNRATDLTKTGKGRVRRNGKPTRMLFRYDLPPEWDLVP